MLPFNYCWRGRGGPSFGAARPFLRGKEWNPENYEFALLRFPMAETVECHPSIQAFGIGT